MNSQLKNIKNDLAKSANFQKALSYSKFFKTGPGEYGEGDIFLGITVPEQRKIAKKHSNLPMSNVEELLNSPVHEHRLTALFILISKYNETKSKQIVDLYLDNINAINNWDLVDLSSPKILGHYLQDKDRNILYELAGSNNLWKKRIAIVSTAAFIRKNEFEDTLKISEILLNDEHDLIQKAVGWMLREIGKRNQVIEEDFIIKHRNMPRTMLRYAIEKFDEQKRRHYLLITKV